MYKKEINIICRKLRWEFYLNEYTMHICCATEPKADSPHCAGEIDADYRYLEFTINPHVLEFVREFGLILFVYTLGLQIGPGFFGSLRERGLLLNGFAAAAFDFAAPRLAGFASFTRSPDPAACGRRRRS